MHSIFYNGDPLTDLEVDIERMYVNAKSEKVVAYGKRKSLRYKVRWTISDLNRHQD
jgi:2-hydroxy-3-keto-5-methylthiopentenyl-1-phosphate phosphatase